MEFDRNKVFTVVNADEAKKGSRGFFADTLVDLKEKVERDDLKEFAELADIWGESYQCRFSRNYKGNYALFYLVEEPAEKKLRPYRDSDEMVADFTKRFNVDCPFYAMPLIWIKGEYTKEFIVSFDKNMIATDSYNLDFNELLNGFTYLDGTACGVEE